VDAELIGRAQRGDEEAFASLAVAAGDRLHAVAHRILRDIDLAEGATQQARPDRAPPDPGLGPDREGVAGWLADTTALADPGMTAT
jgi:RNA polymerase sigma-70 factor (ECF subfamily)